MPKYLDSSVGTINRELRKKRRVVEAAAGKIAADLVLKNAEYLNVFSNELCRGDIAIAEGLIVGVGSYSGKREIDVSGKLVCPGLLDAHIHLESALVSPCEFAKAVIPHGTTTVVTDPHEITNVMGTDGIAYMLEATEGLPLDVHFMLPSCVPCSPLDESGASLNYRAIDSFYQNERVLGLAEMMNYVGVVNRDTDVLEKITAAQLHGKRIDGHAPGLSGNDLNAYIASGVYSDHECATYADGLEKLRKGQYIMIREGTAAKNLKALLPLLVPKYAERCLFCTDDKHPSDLLTGGHIDYIIRKAIKGGVDPIIAVKAATINTARYFHLDNKGAIAPGYLADLIVVDSLSSFQVEQVFKNGECCFEKGTVLPFEPAAVEKQLTEKSLSTFHVDPLTEQDFAAEGMRGIIGMIPGEIVTSDEGRTDHADPANDILKMAVVERHHHTGHIGIGYIKGYGMKTGAVATSISHDSHNIIVVGANDADMAFAVNRILENRGGITVVKDGVVKGELALEIGGLMSDRPLTTVNDDLENAKQAACEMGVNPGVDPFMTLSFMSLAVIPSLRLTTRGVVDVLTQKYL